MSTIQSICDLYHFKYFQNYHSKLHIFSIDLGNGQYLLGGWDQCILSFQGEKSLSYKQSTILSVLRLKKVPSSMIILAKKSMCPIAFCTSPNPPMNIDQSLIDIACKVHSWVRRNVWHQSRNIVLHAFVWLKCRFLSIYWHKRFSVNIQCRLYIYIYILWKWCVFLVKIVLYYLVIY